jgi:hypothetical protein
MARRGIPVTARGWPTRVPGFPGPATIEDSVVITTPEQDSSVWSRLQTLFVEADNDDSVYFAGPQGRKVWVVYYGVAWHNEVATYAWGQIVLMNPSLVVSIPVEGERSIESFGTDQPSDKVILRRAVVVHPPWTIGFETSATPPVGKKVRMRILFVEFDQGEVLPVLP